MRKVKLARLSTTTPQKFLDISVYYDEGGISYATYKQSPRGYYLSVSPVKVEHREGLGDCVSCMLFSGIKTLLEETKRFSQKRLNELGAQGGKLPKYQELIDHVLAKETLTLGTPAPEAAAV